MPEKNLIPQPEKRLAQKPLSWTKGILTWFSKEAIGNWGYEQLGVIARSAIMTTVFAIVVRFASAIPLDLLLIGVLFIVALVFSSLQRLIDKRRKKQTALPESEIGETEKPITENEKSIESLNTQIEGLNQEISKLQGNANALQMCISSRDAKLKQYEWLHEMAEVQARDISNYVKVEVVLLNLPFATRSISFELWIRNSSNYHVTIDDRTEGFILFEGKPLYYQAKVEKKSDALPPGDIGALRIEQPLIPEEAERISQFEDNAPHNFSLNELKISIKGGEGFPQVNPQLLITKDKIPVLREPDVKELQNRIKRLESANAILDKEKSENALQLTALKNQYEWLHSTAQVQARNIGEYVVAERVYFCYHSLTETIPYVVFGVDIFNKSVFDITIENAMEGQIEIAGEPLLRDKIMISNGPIAPTSEGKLTIKQRLSQEEAALIAERGEDRFGSFFYFDKLIIMIGDGTQFPKFERTRLKLPQFIGSNDATHKDEVSALKSEIESLQSELDNLKTHKLTFDIDAPRSQIHVDGHPYDDFYIGFQLYIRFENSDIHPLTVRSVNVLLMKRNEDKTESEIPRDELLIYSSVIENDQQVEHSWEDRNLSINGRELTLYHRVEGHISVSGDYREILNRDCFLRVTMDAMNQQPSSLDFNVKWQNINLGWIGINPRT